MFDIEKARRNGLDEKSIEMLQKINENRQRENSCSRHEFDSVKINGFPKYRCKNCGCEEDGCFVSGYERGLEHGRGIHGNL